MGSTSMSGLRQSARVWLRGRQRFVTASVVLLIVAMVVRVGLIAATDDYRAVTDAADYDRHALSIAQGHGYPSTVELFGHGPTAIRPPGFPHFLAAVYKVSGVKFPHRRQAAGRLAEAITGTLVVGLIG